MMISLLRFEIRERLLRLSSAAYFAVYALLAFMIGISFAGAFQGVSVSFGLSNKLPLNSPVALNFMIGFLAYIGLLVTAPIFGQSINKDYESRFQQILFATPIRKSTYFFIRYFGSAISSVAILSSIGFGLWIATFMPFVDRTLIAENRVAFYAMPYLVNVIPNTLVFGAIFLSLVAIFKKMAPVYVASIGIFTGWLISTNLTADLENKFLAAMVDPFGIEAAGQITRYWSVSEQSTQLVTLTGVLLTNRLLWGAVGLFFLALGYFAFDPFRLPREKSRKSEAGSAAVPGPAMRLPKADLRPRSWKVFSGLAWSEFKQAFSNIYFLMILACGLLYIVAISGQIGKMFGTETLPVTYHVLETVGGSFGLFVAIIITYYTGELVWKDRDQNVDGLIDSKPVSNLFLYLSKLLSLVLLQLFLSVVILVACLLVQIFKGYTHFEMAVYFKSLFIYSLPSKILISVLALFVQTVSRNKYVGHSIIILDYVLSIWLPNLGFEHFLYRVGSLPRATYSDMNGFGAAALPFTALTVYWGLFHFMLAVLTVLLWRRGADHTLRDRLVEFRQRFRPVHAKLLGTAFVAWIAAGAFVFYNTNVLNVYETEKDQEHARVDYERLYKPASKWPQPQLISAKVDADIFPETRGARLRSHLVYRNKGSEPVTKIFMNLSRRAEVQSLVWSRPAKIVEENPRLEVRIFEMEKPLMPKEEMTLELDVRVQPHGFENSSTPMQIVANGTFFNSAHFGPAIGYVDGQEIAEEKTRRKYGLPERPRMPSIDDEEARRFNYISGQATWIDFEAVVSTSKDQIAIAPGYLQKEWEEGDRRYFHYKMDRPILDFYSFLSARYEVKKDRWNDVAIEVYYHPGHDRNLDRMINSVKKGLDYFSANFSPYQFRQFRILEFPRYERFAQAFPNTIPFSEAIGFIAKVKADDPEDVDYPFYVTSHELAHQWWAHQVIGGKVQGSTMLSESLAQYSALMVQEKEYGPKQMKRFLKYELDRYLWGRSQETKKEMPLALNENQPYIHYQKGSLVFYALRDYMGEDVVNKVLKDYIRDVGFQDAPFTTARELVERFRKVAPADKKYLIEDLFDTITLYDNKAVAAEARKEGTGFAVKLTVENRKIRADDQGREADIPMDDWVDIGVYNDKGDLIFLEKRRLKTGKNEVLVSVGEKPAKAGVDPLNKLIDRVSDDQVVPVSATN